MRTVFLIGCLYIGDKISQINIITTEKGEKFFIVIFIGAILFDVVDFLRGK